MKKVLLTGISGFIGQHCAVELIKAGYIVKGSIRNLAKSEQVRAVIGQQVAINNQLEFCELNLLDDKGWDEAMQGVDFVMHVASPFVSKEPKDENELIKPAVEGTLRAIRSAQKAGIKRVVLTSSMVAMLGNLEGDSHITEKSWTVTNAKHITAYLKSKTLAEKAAWEFVDEQTGDSKMELVTIHPGPVYGPTISDNLTGESMSTIKRIITGNLPRMIAASINMSDVRDVAQIHVKALENKEAANHRFIVASNTSHSFVDLGQTLINAGYSKASTKLAPTWMVKFLANFSSEMRGFLPYAGKKYEADISKTKKVFNWEPVAFDTMIVDTAKSVEQVMNKQH